MNENLPDPPQNPAGQYQPEDNLSEPRRAELIAEIDRAPLLLQQAVAGLYDDQFDAKYRNWSLRQIIHHLADGHLNMYLRFKWTLTEETPLVKAYDEGRWAELPDARVGDGAAPLAMVAAVHHAWTQLLRLMTAEQFARCFKHPDAGILTSLDAALSYAAWHGRHHTAQIQWVRDRNDW